MSDDGGYRIPIFWVRRRIDPFTVEWVPYWMHLYPRDAIANVLLWAAGRLGAVAALFCAGGWRNWLCGLALRLVWASAWARGGYPGPFRVWEAQYSSPEHEL